MSRLRCDQLLNGEVDDPARDLAHAASCARCTALLDDHRRERAAFAIPLRRRRRWPLAVAMAVATAAAVIVVVPRVDTTRSKGKPALGFYLKRGEAIHRGGAGELVAPGDVLDFTVDTPRPVFVAVISIDGARHASAYYPAGPLAVAIDAGAHVLPLAVRLDGVLGAERLHGVFCDHPAQVAALLDAIARGAAPAGCVVDALEIEKR